MSTDVYIYVNRKSDNRPSGRYYLGGTGIRQVMSEEFSKSDEVLTGFGLLELGNAACTTDFLASHQKSFYADEMFQVLLDDYLSKPNADDFSYWLVFEY